MVDTRFGGSTNLDVRDSVPDCDAFTAELTALWLTEAQPNNVLSLNDHAGFGKDLEAMHKLLDIADDAYIDVERQLAAAMARD